MQQSSKSASRPATEVAEQPAKLRDPLEAVPHLAPKVDWKEDNLKLVQARITVEASGVISRMLTPRRHKVVRLDDHGSFIWRLIDGKINLYELADRLATRFQLPPDDARKQVAMFVKMLMLRGMIVLEVNANKPQINSDELR